MKLTTFASSAFVALTTLLPTAIAQPQSLVSRIEETPPGPIQCYFNQVKPAKTPDFAPVVKELRSSSRKNMGSLCVENWACNKEDREHINEGWKIAACDEKTGAAIWLQTWEDDVFCLPRADIGKMAQLIIDACADDKEKTTRGYMIMNGKQQWVEVGWAKSCKQPKNPHNNC
ncbi:hypothetical protein AJ79_03828 [Helicocarpus griseus UAMH5409]|uniref:Ecp2 effector protein domain-containing protein n=1 Tax=Helicocarpus griseus UAMH5409 TaxID=1447875 RepID=A0A2B7XWH5_9EURO|nr:hypothetical protein AJ79_03828 [Helicocarpus griseus UAMH5409]